MQFKDIIGQNKLKQYLIKCVNEGRIPHAQLLWGGEGRGKLALALAMAQYINCPNRTDSDSCGVCPSCKQFSSLTHPDLHFVFPIANKEKYDNCDDVLPQWREFIKKSPYFNLNQWLDYISCEGKQALIYSSESEQILKKLSLKTFSAEYKTMIIWLPEKMHTVCANKLLKILEEPPSKTLFIMVSENPESLLDTIISRSQMIAVPAIDSEDLSEKFDSQIVKLAKGNYIKACELSGNNQNNVELFNAYRNLMLMAVKNNVLQSKMFAEDMHNKGREACKEFLSYCQHITRECFIANMQQPDINAISPHENTFAYKFCNYLNVNNIEPIIELFASAYNDIERNVSIKMVFFDTSLQLMTLIK